MAEATRSTGERVDDIAALLEEIPAPAQTLRTDLPATPRPPSTVPPLRLSVVWGDLTQTEADAHVVGHYQGVVPTSAEAALDSAISGSTERTSGDTRRVIEEATRRRWLVEQLGVVTFFPVGGGDGPIRRAAVVSMGRVGTFNRRRAVQLFELMLTRLSSLDGVASAATVLVGLGAGNLSVASAAAALVEGALLSRRLLGLQPPDRLDRLVIVEMDRLRADAVHAALKMAIGNGYGDGLVLDPDVDYGKGGRISRRGAVELLARAVAHLTITMNDEAAMAVVDKALRMLNPSEAPLVQLELQKLAAASESSSRDTPATTTTAAPTRLSVVSEERALRWGAITDQATVPERILPVPEERLNQLATRLERPADKDVSRLAEGLSRLLVPVDLQYLLGDHAPVVVEVDNGTARLQWEMLVDLRSNTSSQGLPLAVRTPIARQLRTTHSRPATAVDEGQAHRALVIGDPGNPRTHRSLPGARLEATTVESTLKPVQPLPADWDVNLFLAAPESQGAGLEGTEAADLLDLLMELMSGQYQIVHFAGHGLFDPSDPRRRAGFLFSDGLLTSQDLTNLGRPPRMVVANACFSAKLSSTSPDAAGAAGSQFLPSLADEFLKAGVVHYIGAAWEVRDRAGAMFAEAFYRSLTTPGTTVGEAVCRGREALWHERSRFGCDWAAYQHYGDPCDVLVRQRGTVA